MNVPTLQNAVAPAAGPLRRWSGPSAAFAVVLATVSLLVSRPADGAAAAGGRDGAVAHTAPAGRYVVDRSHASLGFRVNHVGFSMYTARFDRFDAALDFDPAAPARMKVEASIEVGSLSLPAPPAGFHDQLMGAAWFDAKAHPRMTFRSTGVKPTGADTAIVSGEMTLRGVTRPVSLDVRFNGGYAGMRPYEPQARIGFSAKGSLKRSEFGMTDSIPEKGSMVGVSDRVDFVIEAEFSGPPLPPG